MMYDSYHKCFEVLANPLRFRIVAELQKRPESVGALASALKEEQSKISHALQVLRKCRFVEAERRGKEKLYSISRAFGKMKTSGNMLDSIAAYRQNVCRTCSKEHGA